ncbi:unannotated protein [freshwater metagenome]|uniref:Unannotated protein n=1 Tax=freshwater metagenome TaxID=449393 RepID=A0A6J6LSK7_9ZZZZ
MPKWWLEQKAEVAHAIHEAEATSGHQIVVHVGNLGRHPEKRADQLAVKWSGASLVFCVDPRHRHFEIRWAESLQLDGQLATQVVTEPLRAQDLASAITALAALLPVQQEGAELPDIVNDDE